MILNEVWRSFSKSKQKCSLFPVIKETYKGYVYAMHGDLFHIDILRLIFWGALLWFVNKKTPHFNLLTKMKNNGLSFCFTNEKNLLLYWWNAI